MKNDNLKTTIGLVLALALVLINDHIYRFESCPDYKTNLIGKIKLLPLHHN